MPKGEKKLGRLFHALQRATADLRGVDNELVQAVQSETARTNGKAEAKKTIHEVERSLALGVAGADLELKRAIIRYQQESKRLEGAKRRYNRLITRKAEVERGIKTLLDRIKAAQPRPLEPWEQELRAEAAAQQKKPAKKSKPQEK